MITAIKNSNRSNSIQLSFDFDTLFGDYSESFLNVKLACLKNIKELIPQLYPEQHEDVLKAEKRFEKAKGILFTNGTGTGKTFTGLGIAKRFYLQNKKNILIVVPTDKKCQDWIDEAIYLDLDIYQLQNIQDPGRNIRITTYANFYQNELIENLDFDLVIYDESHYLLQNSKGDATQALLKHKRIAKLPSSFDNIYRDKLRNSCKYYSEYHGRYIVDDTKFEKLYNQKLNEYIEQTKVVFLSATPFAYHKSLLIGDGTLFEIYETPKLEKDTYYGYNETNKYENFFVENFGYRMRYNKLTTPENDVDINLMERSFFDKYEELGIFSGRQIEVDKDYSRDFVTVESLIGNQIDDGKKLLSSKEFRDNYPCLSDFANRKFTYHYTNQLLECIKAKASIERIKEHLILNRKIVIFHSYNHANIEHPFKFNSYDLLKNDELEKYQYKLNQEIVKFEDEYKHLLELDLSDLFNVRKTILDNFPNITREFNGTISATKRKKFINEFNDDNSDIKIIVVQTKAGKEGISLHDTSNLNQRALLNLGLPTAPTDAIQIEGRIYRIGVLSNAIYEYITLQTNFERFAFADKIAERSRTAENLAMGSKARNLEIVFKEGYQNSTDDLPSINQGTGGKESDYNFEIISEFQKSISYYYSNQKRNSKTKSNLGIDYFATPEPIGFKIAEWLNIQPGEDLLEPSAGHGAIARFFPENTNNKFVESSYELASKLAINTYGSIYNQQFEHFSIVNKFDKIAMNPPFGNSGKLAIQHIEKACKHLSFKDNATLIAIIPNSNQMDLRLEKLFKSFEDDYRTKDLSITSELILPNCTFNRAGTTVSTKIITIKRENSIKTQTDLSYIQNINELFNKIENM